MLSSVAPVQVDPSSNLMRVRRRADFQGGAPLRHNDTHMVILHDFLIVNLVISALLNSLQNHFKLTLLVEKL